MQPGDSATFSHTTLSNLDPSSFALWLYTVLLLSYLPVGGFVMRRRLKQVLCRRLALYTKIQMFCILYCDVYVILNENLFG